MRRAPGYEGHGQNLERGSRERWDTPSFRDSAAYGIQGDVVVCVEPTEPPDEVANVEVQEKKHSGQGIRPTAGNGREATGPMGRTFDQIEGSAATA